MWAPPSQGSRYEMGGRTVLGLMDMCRRSRPFVESHFRYSKGRSKRNRISAGLSRHNQPLAYSAVNRTISCASRRPRRQHKGVNQRIPKKSTSRLRSHGNHSSCQQPNDAIDRPIVSYEEEGS